MLEKTTRLLSENLARAMDRRAFMRKAGTTTFAGLAALASGHMLPQLAAAARKPLPGPRLLPDPIDIPAVPRCAPPGPYCNTNGTILSGCHGGSCFQHLYNGTVYQCKVYYTYYQAGCWTTADSGGYWTCCDCECGTPRVATCGCAQFNLTPSPRPDNIKGGSRIE